jgi:hypothetical protein
VLLDLVAQAAFRGQALRDEGNADVLAVVARRTLTVAVGDGGVAGRRL